MIHTKWHFSIRNEYLKQIGKEEGLAEGIAKGRLEVKTKMVKRLPDDKEFSSQKIAAIAEVPITFSVRMV